MLGYYFPAPTPQTPMHNWQGQSSRWYVHSIYAISADFSFVRACNYIFAKPRFGGGGTREPLYTGESGDFAKELRIHPKLDAARALGATEIHLHFLANSLRERLDIETDLRQGHWTPLNYQPTPAQPSAYNALATLGIGGFGAAPPAVPAERNALADLSKLGTFSGFGGFPLASNLDWLLRR